MENYKRRFSIDAPIPYSGGRRQSEPVQLFSASRRASSTLADPKLSRRYSTALNAPLSGLHGRTDTENERHKKYSSNKEVRKLSLNLALQEALAEEYGFTPIYGIPIIYTPPPDKLYTSICYIELSTGKKRKKGKEHPSSQ